MYITTYYSVIGDEVTYRIGLLLSRWALSVNEVSNSLQLSQSQVSHKLAKLRKYNYVNHRRDGKRVIYRFSEPWRSLLLHGDINWRKLNPEFASAWREDEARLRRIVGDMSDREIHPVITGPPSIPADGKGHPGGGHPGGHPG